MVEVLEKRLLRIENPKEKVRATTIFKRWLEMLPKFAPSHIRLFIDVGLKERITKKIEIIFSVNFNNFRGIFFLSKVNLKIKKASSENLPLKLLTPQVGLEPTTLRLHFLSNFRLSVDYLFNFQKSCRTLFEILLVRFPQSLVSARSCLPFEPFSRLRSGLPY